MVYSIYILPVLTFIGQLEAEPTNWDTVEAEAIQALLPGGFRWILPKDTHFLKEYHGQARSVPCLVDTLLAAKARVRKLDAVAHGGHKIGASTEELCN